MSLHIYTGQEKTDRSRYGKQEVLIPCPPGPTIQLKIIYIIKMHVSVQFKVLVNSGQLCYYQGAESNIQLNNGITLRVFYCFSCAIWILLENCLAFFTYILKPSYYLQQSDSTVKLAAFSGGNFVILLESGKVLVFNGTTHSWGDPYGENKRFSFFTSLIKIIDKI